MREKDPPARAALAAWLEKHEKSHAWLAEKIDSHQTAVSLWLRSGIPTIKFAQRIQTVTGIAVGQWVS